MVSSSGYDLLLKPIDHVLADNAAAVAGRWVSSTSCTDRQVYDYWGQKEADGFVYFKTPSAEVATLTCNTSKEATKDYKRMIRQGRLGGVLIACTSSGYILHIAPFTEAIPLRYFFIAALRCLDARWYRLCPSGIRPFFFFFFFLLSCLGFLISFRHTTSAFIGCHLNA